MKTVLTPVEELTIRRATVEDLEILTAHRIAMFYDMGYHDEAALEAMGSKFAAWVEPRLASGEYLAWLAVDTAGAIAAGLGIWLMAWPPHVIHPGPYRANVLNVYTRPDDRRRGLARALMMTAIEWCRENSVRTMILHASPEGRDLYQQFGFRPTNEMRLLLDE